MIVFNVFGCVLKGFKPVKTETSLKLTNIKDRTDVDRFFPVRFGFFPKKKISEDRTGPGLVQKRLKNRTGPNLETLGLFPPLFFVFLILTNVLLYIQVKTYGIHDRTVVTMRKCPNDARHVLFGP